MRTHLYRHYDREGRLLYVGISLSAVYRLAQHKHGSHWAADIRRVEIEEYPTREEAEAAEVRAIKTEAPMHNKQHAENVVTLAHGAWWLSWSPCTDQVLVTAGRLRNKRVHGFTMDVPLRGTPGSEQLKMQIFVEAVHLIVRDGMPPAAVHDALLVIPEYRDGLADDMPGMKAWLWERA